MGKKMEITVGIIIAFFIKGNIGYGESLKSVSSNNTGKNLINIKENKNGQVILDATNDIVLSGDSGKYYAGGATESIAGKNITIEGTKYEGIEIYNDSKIIITGEETVNITGKGNGIYFDNSIGEILGKDINIKGSDYNGINLFQNSRVDVIGEDTLNITGNYNGVYLSSSGTANFQGKKIDISGNMRGLYLAGNGTINLKGESTSIVGKEQGILIDNGGKSEINSDKTVISGGEQGIWIREKGSTKIKSNEVTIFTADKDSAWAAIYTITEGEIAIESDNTNISSDKIGLYAQSGNIVINANEKNVIKGKNEVAVYATSENDKIGKIKISGKSNHILGEEGVKAINGEIIINSIEDTIITADTWGVHANSPTGKIGINSQNTVIIAQASDGKGIAASTGADLKINSQNTFILGKEYSIYAHSPQKPVSSSTLSEITLSENGRHEIYGNIKSSGNANITIGGKGNKISSSSNSEPLKVVAEDGGKIDISLVDGILTGNIDDKRTTWAKGTVNLNLDNGIWETKGKSFVTSIEFKNNGNIIFSEKGTSVDIENLQGDGSGTFGMKLNSVNKAEGNMLYIQESNGGVYNIAVQNSELEDIKTGEKIRFATIGENAKTNNLGFKVSDVKERGIRNVSFKVEKEDFDKNDSENEIYNGATSNDNKPGNGYVEKNYGTGENWYLTRNSNGNINDGGISIIEMAKSNYANVAYMDNLNKRLGDMSFADGESGLWIRIRNDRVGEDDQYRLYNYMTQIGYDESYSMENGTEHIGIAFEYGRGDMKYKELNGSTDTDKYILTLYNTKVSNNKIYTDYTLRGGAISNNFTVYGRETGTKVTGKYKNMLLGAGVETGKRFDIDKNWYFEPQAQLQYTYINSTDYTTNQMTKVDLDEIHSLIGRIGVRIGHDLYRENLKDNTIYMKADINHEFLGKQNIKAKDETGTLDEAYNNDETWFDIGIGVSKKITSDFNVYTDVEKQFGSNKGNKSWQVNLGFRYKF